MEEVPQKNIDDKDDNNDDVHDDDDSATMELNSNIQATPTPDAPEPQTADNLSKRLEQIAQELDTLATNAAQTQPQPVSVQPKVSEEFYPVKKIIRGKWTPFGPKYLVHWENYPASQATWEPWENLSPETQQNIQDNPVRMFGRKPSSVEPETTTDVTCPSELTHTSPDPLFYEMTEAEREDAYNADTESESDPE